MSKVNQIPQECAVDPAIVSSNLKGPLTPDPAAEVSDFLEAAPEASPPEGIGHVQEPEDAGPEPFSVHPSIITFHNATSPCQEDFRRIQVAIYRMAQSNPIHTILVTSSIRNEGKSTLTLNLAVTFAQEVDRPILIVDGDMRRPSVDVLLGFEAEAGLSDYLEGRVRSLEPLIINGPIPNLSILPTRLANQNPAELLVSKPLKEALNELGKRFAFVFIDSPPVLPVPDSAMLARDVDGVIFAVEAGRTKKRAALRGIELLGDANLLGFVLTKSEPTTLPRSYERYPDYIRPYASYAAQPAS